VDGRGIAEVGIDLVVLLGLDQLGSGAEVLVVHLRERVAVAGGIIQKETIEESMEFGQRVADDLASEGSRQPPISTLKPQTRSPTTSSTSI
jgi:hypothetical protein